jgi:NAD(P)-dependent dehydrogenase (short-subunit alcohol dehydrogenase family)
MRFADGTTWEDPHKLAADGVPGGVAGTPEHVADAILFLSGDQSSYVNGSELVLDAALTA